MTATHAVGRVAAVVVSVAVAAAPSAALRRCCAAIAEGLAHRAGAASLERVPALAVTRAAGGQAAPARAASHHSGTHPPLGVLPGVQLAGRG